MKRLIPDWFPAWIIILPIVILALYGANIALETLLMPSGITQSSDEVWEIYASRKDDLYKSFLKNSKHRRFPFPPNVKWRHVKRGGWVTLTGKTNIESLVLFCEDQNTEEDLEYAQLQSVYFHFRDGNATTTVYAYPQTGEFRVVSSDMGSD